MSGGSQSENSPDPRFEIVMIWDNEGTSYIVSFSELVDDEENPLYETDMPDGEPEAIFQFLADAESYVVKMAKCLDEGTTIKCWTITVETTKGRNGFNWSIGRNFVFHANNSKELSQAIAQIIREELLPEEEVTI